MHLAELNIGKPRFPVDDPRMSEFTDNLARVNAMAEKMPGFVWMHKDDTGHAMHMPTPWPGMAANLSVWETAEALEHFVWNTVHKRFYNRKHEWFSPMAERHMVLWWVEPGHRPDLREAKARLDHLEAHGDTEHAFSWAYLPHIRLWQEQRCG